MYKLCNMPQLCAVVDLGGCNVSNGLLATWDTLHLSRLRCGCRPIFSAGRIYCRHMLLHAGSGMAWPGAGICLPAARWRTPPVHPTNA